jgi:N-acetylmuramoyl-L-alanine amidase
VASTTTTAPATTTTANPWPVLPTGGAAKAIVTPNGVVLPVDDDGVATTPCGTARRVDGQPLFGAHVVVDPGHGGDEPGAVGPAGLREKDVNLTIAREVERILESHGATVVLTRTADYRITLRTRAAIATRLSPLAFVSIHHNASPDGPRDGPGAETYSQIGSAESKRLSGLLYEEVVAAFDRYDAAWVADRDAGAKYRPADDGGDYYGILRRTAGVPAVLSEAAFITNATEETLLATASFQHAEAAAIARAVTRFVSTDDPGGGYVTPYPRSQPAGPGGGPEGCVDPALS